VGAMLADEQFQWFYWIGVLMLLGLVPLLFLLSAGYVRKVLLPKYRGKRVEE
jgi:hypothetical protein